MKLSAQENSVLTLLARRANNNDENVTHWNFIITMTVSNRTSYYRCLICDKQVYSSLIQAHGYQHLKETNLLTFI